MVNYLQSPTYFVSKCLRFPLHSSRVKLAANVRMKALNKGRKEEGIEHVSLGVFPLQEKTRRGWGFAQCRLAKPKAGRDMEPVT